MSVLLSWCRDGSLHPSQHLGRRPREGDIGAEAFRVTGVLQAETDESGTSRGEVTLSDMF